MIDIEEMIGKRRYKVALPPEEVFSEIESVLLADTVVQDETEWIPISGGERFRSYTSNLLYMYIIRNYISLKLKYDHEEVRKRYYSEHLSDGILNTLRYEVPITLNIIIRKVDEFGSECEGTCSSVLYEKLTKKLADEEEIKNFIIKDSKIASERFLDQIFIGILGGEVIEEVKDDLVLKLLMNDSGTREITKIIDKLFNEATTEILICGWIGTHYIPKLLELKSKGINVKFITHKPGEAKGQPWKSEVEEAYRSLCTDFGLDKISNAHNIHGRTIVVDNKALIGTMDLNSSSLTGVHTEFAIFTDDPDIVRRMRVIFNTKFEPLSASE